MRWLFALALILWTGAAGRDALDAWLDATKLPPLLAEMGVEVHDRDGQLLRAYTAQDGRWRLAVGLDAVDPGYLAMLIRYEDKRFYDHAGVDPLALIRGGWQALRSGQIVSGGSTLTMQVARLIEGGPTGRWSGKLRQMRVALALERRLGKDEILTLYLNRAPFGGNLEGVRAASLAWFGKPPRRLTPAQRAMLVALPQSPEARRPDRDAGAATQARNRVLARMQAAGLLDAQTRAAAMRHDVPATRFGFPALAPHLADRARAEAPFETRHQLTVSHRMQSALEALARQAASGRSDRVQAAIVVADHQTGDVLASVGSAAYRADGRAGFLDLTQAVRSPGSTLKPLVYGLAFDRGLLHPETLIADRPRDFDGYAPQNFDGLYRGELRVRSALQHSLNIPVVSVTQALGPHHLMAGLRRAGATPDVPGGVPGLAVALGGVGVTLEDLVALYAALGNGGQAVGLHWRVGQSGGPRGLVADRVIGDVAAWQVADILREVPRPRGVMGTGIAYKTGTSYGHRDAWAIGFDGRHVIGVWMGRADGTPVPGAFGGELAAPVMFEAFARIKSRIDPLPPPPAATLLLPTARLPLPLQRFRSVADQVDGPQIAFPPDGAVLDGGTLTARLGRGAPPFTWLANGLPVAVTHRRAFDLGTIEPGFSTLAVIDATGRTDRVEIEVRD